MTREEAKERFLSLHPTDRFIVIDEMYDDFESRKCKNCEHYDMFNDDSGFCIHDWYHEFDYVKGDVIKVNKNFGCNGFERRTNETN